MCFNVKTVLIEELNSTVIDIICFVNYLVNLTPICFRFCYKEIQIRLFFFLHSQKIVKWYNFDSVYLVCQLNTSMQKLMKKFKLPVYSSKWSRMWNAGDMECIGGIKLYSWYQTLKRDDVLVKYKVRCEIINNQRAGKLPWLTLTLMR